MLGSFQNIHASAVAGEDGPAAPPGPAQVEIRHIPPETFPIETQRELQAVVCRARVLVKALTELRCSFRTGDLLVKGSSNARGHVYQGGTRVDRLCKSAGRLCMSDARVSMR